MYYYFYHVVATVSFEYPTYGIDENIINALQVKVVLDKLSSVNITVHIDDYGITATSK